MSSKKIKNFKFLERNFGFSDKNRTEVLIAVQESYLFERGVY